MDSYHLAELEAAVATLPIEGQNQVEQTVDIIQEAIVRAILFTGSTDMVFTALTLASARFAHQNGMFR